MTLTIRRIQIEDAESCGSIAFEAHRDVAAANGFPPEHPTVEFSIGLIKAKLNDPTAYGVLAECDGQIAGSVFLNMFPSTPVAAIGPLTVRPSDQGGTGRRLMEAALSEARKRGLESVRLVQSPAHIRSLVLYAKLGFEVREPLLLVQGVPPGADIEGRTVRPATGDDLAACNSLCVSVHGIQREHELRAAVEQHLAAVVERSSRITGYATGIGFRGYAVAQTTDDLKALISRAPAFLGPGFFVPVRNGELLRWLLSAGLRAAWPATLMTAGPYREPAGAFLPSIAF
jgi:GNAT superfamily N-acetyltransferase